MIYGEYLDEQRREEYAAAEIGACLECGFTGGRHNEGACSRWSDDSPPAWERGEEDLPLPLEESAMWEPQDPGYQGPPVRAISDPRMERAAEGGFAYADVLWQTAPTPQDRYIAGRLRISARSLRRWQAVWIRQARRRDLFAEIAAAERAAGWDPHP